jgi:hypothetical protein
MKKRNNPTITFSNDSEVDEMSDKKFKRMIIRMINEFKENTNKYLNE